MWVAFTQDSLCILLQNVARSNQHMHNQATQVRTLQIVAAIRLKDSAFLTLRLDYSTEHNAADKPNQ